MLRARSTKCARKESLSGLAQRARPLSLQPMHETACSIALIGLRNVPPAELRSGITAFGEGRAMSTSTADAQSTLPLHGIRVLDLASYIAAPVAATVMADYGATVIKVEPPNGGDPNRSIRQVSSYPPSDGKLSLGNGQSRQTLDSYQPTKRERSSGLISIDQIDRCAHHQFATPRAPPPENRLRRRQAPQSEIDLRSLHRLRRNRSRSRPSRLRQYRLFRPLRSVRLQPL